MENAEMFYLMHKNSVVAIAKILLLIKLNLSRHMMW